MKALYLSTTGDSTIEIPETLEVEGYYVGIVELHGKLDSKRGKTCYLCSDICEESIIGENRLPILRSIHRKPNGTLINDEMYKVIWLKVMRPSISTIRLYICDETGEIITLGKNSLTCTLLLIPPNKNNE